MMLSAMKSPLMPQSMFWNIETNQRLYAMLGTPTYSWIIQIRASVPQEEVVRYGLHQTCVKQATSVEKPWINCVLDMHVYGCFQK